MPHLDHPLLDELLAVAASGDSSLPPLHITSTVSIAALLEYSISRAQGLPLPTVLEGRNVPITLPSITKLSEAQDVQARSLELALIPADRSAPPWRWFLQRLSATATKAGFAKPIAAGLAGAVGELADNVGEHSNHNDSGIVGYSMTRQGFEFVVSDEGRGIRSSLATSSEFSSLRDDIEAVQTAVLSAASRFGRQSGRGQGFRTVLRPLRAAPGMMRVRSGIAVLTIETDVEGKDRGICGAKPFFQGTLVCGRLFV